MSLDVFLKIKGAQLTRPDRIYIREKGSNVEISRAEWDKLFPGQEPVVLSDPSPTDYVYEANITHNLKPMAMAAGLAIPLWEPERLGIVRAEQLIKPIRIGLTCLENNQQTMKALNPSNGWGTYEDLLKFTRDYLAACLEYPTAEVLVWR